MTLFGAFSYFIPYTYSVVPVYETQACWRFFKNSSPFLRVDPTCFMATANKITFISTNFFELMLLIILLYKIRDIKDELNIKIELNILIILWLLFSMLYFITNNIYDAKESEDDPINQ